MSYMKTFEGKGQLSAHIKKLIYTLYPGFKVRLHYTQNNLKWVPNCLFGHIKCEIKLS